MREKLIKFSSLYHPKLPFVIIYMLQQVEYDPVKFGAWVDKFPDYTKVIRRQKLVLTSKAKLLLAISYSAWSLCLMLILVSLFSQVFIFAVLLTVFLPAVTMGSVTLAVVAGSILNSIGNKSLIAESKTIFDSSKAIKIAVIGSYGKTTMKEILSTVLSEGKKVAATPGNMNVSVSHTKFAKNLSGEEEILIIEFGEGRPGDVLSMSNTITPDYAIITGLAPNHLDYYPSLDAIAKDLLSVRDVVDENKLFITGESEMLNEYIKDGDVQFSVNGLKDWKISKVELSVHGTKFSMNKGKQKLNLSSKLLGRHQIAPLACVASLAHDLGLSNAEIERGIANTAPFSHRMEARLVHGAWIIDDTYNGNLEGLKAGLRLLTELKFKRKWYVTPGLVDQGDETTRVHEELGKAIAEAGPAKVVLMENSACPVIEKSMKEHGFSGELIVETDPIEFYTNIEHVVAAGDLVLMQNDWTDNYN